MPQDSGRGPQPCATVADEPWEATVIYCVVPPELGEDAFKRLVEHYRDNPNVKVIMDRRRGERREGHDATRQTSGRRRRRMPGNFDI